MVLKSYYQWAAVALAGTATAQTSTTCNPMKKSCPANTGLNKYHFNADLTSGSLDHWKTTAGKVDSDDLGAKFTVAKQGDAPTLESEFYIFFGHVDVRMRTASGTGIISTWILESDDLDEIDWEQISTYDSKIQTDYFGKGNTTSYDREGTVAVSKPEDTFHTYSIDWTSERIEWSLDGKVERTLKYADAVGGQNYPQTPMRVRLGIWAGGDPDNEEGTIEWAGGTTDYSSGPFSMYIESVDIVNYNPAAAYEYTDMTGSYKSIKATNASMATNLSSDDSKSDDSKSGDSKSDDSSSSTTARRSASSPEGSASVSHSASPSPSAESAASSIRAVSAVVIALVSVIAGLVQF
ncbi:uncharacterized protein N7515_004492 [Penicillium bovifimosum]|uniref:Crh-like protein n=1 Tax=Penicillium bovifimosum TaxID=126998 RepID=A0A9W9H090_9EURO|nr:uncharacterized protein N7515_004492 [Penicillium bovifimosum]KAJ5135214.1 hypothetical protein N7515_004492 [Penicillium bovifimosum]